MGFRLGSDVARQSHVHVPGLVVIVSMYLRIPHVYVPYCISAIGVLCIYCRIHINKGRGLDDIKNRTLNLIRSSGLACSHPRLQTMHYPDFQFSVSVSVSVSVFGYWFKIEFMSQPQLPRSVIRRRTFLSL